MKRRIIKIDRNKCNGCGACANACHEGAIGMVNGKAKLLRDDYCDGLGDCLPACPTGAITFVEREAAAYDEAAVQAAKKAKGEAFHGCPGQRMHLFHRAETAGKAEAAAPAESQLAQWPCQIRLVPVKAPYFDGAKLLVAADCTAYAYASFHQDFMRGRVTVIGCPKLDAVDYREKLTAILESNDIRELTILRRAGDGGQGRPEKEREVHPLERGHGLGGRKDPGLTGKTVVSSEETGQTERKTRKEHAVWRK